MPLSQFLLTALVPLAGAAAVAIQAREFVPKALPQKAPAEQLLVQPSLDWDKDGCYNVAAIGADGTFAEGMPAKGGGQAGCRDEVDIDNSNVYSRRRCNSGWCVTIYDYYFEKDVALSTGTGGHRHDIEHIAVWTQNNKVQYVGASAHGKYSVRARKDVLFKSDQGGEHPLIVYHKDGVSTHAFRFARQADVDKPENHKGAFWRNALVGWDNFPTSDLRNALMNHDFGKAHFAISDKNFAENIKNSKPKEVTFDATRDA